MNVTIFGSGYVGLVQAAVFADVGHNVICMDVDKARIQKIKDGVVPFHEPGLEPLLTTALDNGRLQIIDNAQEAVQSSDFLFICVGTPANEDGSADLQYIDAVAESIAENIDARKVVVTKSTVPVGTADRVNDIISNRLSELNKDVEFDVVSNPEFTKEGEAIRDCQRPDRIILGGSSNRALDELKVLYQPFNRIQNKFMVMDARSAELTKYAANAMLATKISFMNEMANIAEQVGADIEHVRHGIGSDPRIGYQFIYPGCGYGGSCFPKDVRALNHQAKITGYDASLIASVHSTNEKQKQRLLQKILNYFNQDVTKKVIAIWGLSFKPNTDDIREAPSRVLIDGLLQRGAQVCLYDPQAIKACKAIYGDQPGISYANSKESALNGASALAICTEWKEFRAPDFDLIKSSLSTPVIFDGRNLYEPQLLKAQGIKYIAIGRSN